MRVCRLNHGFKQHFWESIEREKEILTFGRGINNNEIMSMPMTTYYVACALRGRMWINTVSVLIEENHKPMQIRPA